MEPESFFEYFLNSLLHSLSSLAGIGVQTYKCFGVGVYSSKAGVESESKTLDAVHLCQVAHTRDDHYLVYRLDIRQDSEFATGYGYPKTAFKREPYDPIIRNAVIDISRIRLLEKVAHCTITHSLSSEASFQLSVP